MSVTYSPGGGGNKDQVRLLIFDTDVDNAIFQDEEVNRFLTIQESDVLLAAAMALETMASREAMVQKVIRLMDLSTNGPAVAKELREHARLLREQAEIGAVESVEWVNTVFQERERLLKQVQRGEL